MTVAVVPREGADATLFNEAGSALSDEDWDRLLALVEQHVEGAGVLVCSGSMPPAAPDDLCARVVELARRRGAGVVIDTSGPALVAAAEAGADVLKPNTAELLEALDVSDPVDGARTLCGYGAGAVVLSRGPDGMVAVTPEGEWRAVPPFVVRGNPTGAGDAAVAALATGADERWAWPVRLRAAVAWSAAAVASPLAGSVDVPALRRIYDDVLVEAL
jgi:tagatose 6-phosphate kinase